MIMIIYLYIQVVSKLLEWYDLNPLLKSLAKANPCDGQMLIIQLSLKDRVNSGMTEAI